MGKVTRSKGSKKLLRSARHKKSGKYERQRVRTEANKAKRKARLFSIVLFSTSSILELLWLKQ